MGDGAHQPAMVIVSMNEHEKLIIDREQEEMMLIAQRMLSVKMVKLFFDATARLRHEFGSLLAVSFEWPRYCEGWGPGKSAVATRRQKELPRVIDFDGCAFGLVSRKGGPMKKPWGIVTEHCGIGDSMRKLCSRRQTSRPGGGRRCAARATPTSW